MDEKKTEIAVAQQTAAAPAPAPVVDVMAMWNSITEMAANPEINADKIGALIGMQERMMDRAAEQAFIAAKNAAMAEMPVITKDNRIEHGGRLIGMFNKYDDIRKIIDPILLRHGLRISHDSGMSEAMKMPTVRAVLSFSRDGMAWVEKGGEMAVPFDTGGAKSGAQGAGSSLQYGMRYTTCSMLGIVQDVADPDGRDRGKQQGQAAGGVQIDTEQALRMATAEAENGLARYTEFFKSSQLTHLQRGWLMESGKHTELKARAAEVGA